MLFDSVTIPTRYTHVVVGPVPRFDLVSTHSTLPILRSVVTLFDRYVAVVDSIRGDGGHCRCDVRC